MENLSLLLFISIAVPLGMMLVICKGKMRMFVVFLLLGMVAGLFCGELNKIVLSIYPNINDYSVDIAPIIEEIVKALPILFLAFVFKPERQLILELSVATGVGFAVLENAFVFVSAPSDILLVTALIRAFGAGMMHGITTLAVGFGLSFVCSQRNVAFAGTIALLSTAIVYHSMYNTLVISGYTFIGFLLPSLTLMLALFIRQLNKKKLIIL